VVAVDSAARLFATGYGRAMLTKIAQNGRADGIGKAHRAAWLPAAKSHRVTADVTRSPVAVTGWRNIRPGMMGPTAG
jgi:copper resistance protein D